MFQFNAFQYAGFQSGSHVDAPVGVDDYLVKRLRPSHGKQSRWVELARALQEYWQYLFNIHFDELASTRSIYTATKAGQLRKIEEYGWYYEQDMPDSSRPVFLGMRRLEMLQKETDVPMMASIQRLGVTGCWWEPLLAVDSEAYGTRFIHSIDREKEYFDPDSLYLTSRGALMINPYKVNDLSLLPKTEQIISEVKPLHIIYDKTVAILDPEKPTGPFIGCAAVCGEGITVYPLNVPEVSLQSVAFAAAGTQVSEKTSVYPKPVAVIESRSNTYTAACTQLHESVVLNSVKIPDTTPIGKAIIGKTLRVGR